MSHVQRYKWVMSNSINESFHRYEWVMSPSSWPPATSHVHMYEWVTSQIQTGHVTDTNESCLHHRRHLQREISMNMNDSCPNTNEPCLHRHGPLQYVTFTHLNASCHRYKWIMSQIRMSHVSIIVVTCNESCPWIWMSRVTDTNEACLHNHHHLQWVMGWLRLVGSLKL